MAKRILEYIFQIFINILLVVLVATLFFAVYSYVTLEIMHNDYVNCFGYTFFEVASGSMEDYISVSDIVIVKIKSDYKEGDVVTYYSDGDFVTHRIISIKEGTIITRGDANNSNDNPINNTVILGRVVHIIHNAGIWKKIFMTPRVFISMMITLLLFSFTFSYNRKRPKRKKINDKNKFEDNSISDLHVTDPEIPYVRDKGDK